MTPDAVARHLAGLPGCVRKGTSARPAWYVANRLVCRLENPTTLVIRSGFDAREQLVGDHPETFGVPPSMERHMKVQAVLDRGNDDAVLGALTAAYDLQRNR